MAISVHVDAQGGHFVNAKGDIIQVRGVNVSGLESGIIFGPSGSTDYWASSNLGGRPDFTKIAAWKANAVRLPLNEDSWLGLTVTNGAGTTLALNGPGYQAEVKATVAAANAAGLYVILDLHWTAPSNFAADTQNTFLNSTNSLNFWSSVATAFQANQAVMFEVFNEPVVCPSGSGNALCSSTGIAATQAAENQVLATGGPANSYVALNNGNGGAGSVTRYAYSYSTVSYQAAINAIRAAGANNVIICGGNNYDDDLTWWTTNPPTDSLNKLAAAVHQYPGEYPNNAATDGPTAGINAMLAPIAANHPVIVTELGDEVGTAGSPFASPVLAWADTHDYSVMAWAWNPWGGANTLIQNTTSYTPTVGLGVTYYTWTFNHL
jgi:endoglucanase